MEESHMERPFTLDNMNHVVIRVRDLEKSRSFYEMLGGKLEGEGAAGSLVRIANSGQSIILQERSDYVPAAVSAIDHINLMIKADDIQDVARYLRENGVELVGEPTLGRPGPTVNALDPDGYMLEIRIIRDS